MPLVRVQVRNEYGLGQPELYREANREDPKAVLDGVAVAGLVGILRQLGDLAEFAAEVFHGLQEQVMSTSSRSHKLMVRLQHLETALPPIEKAILAQKSHLHFAYTSGSVWHPHLKNEQNHFIYSDLPPFIMDSYEESRDPPRLHLLDKFDTGGPGSCLKRYSDPAFFRRASASLGQANVGKVSKDKKVRRSKKNRTRQRNEASHHASISNYSDRMQYASLNIDGQVSPSRTVSTFDATFTSDLADQSNSFDSRTGQVSPPRTVPTFDATSKSDLGDQSNSFDLRTGSGYIECVFHPTYSTKHEENGPKESSFPSLRMHHNDTIDTASVDEHNGVVDDGSPHSLSPEQSGPRSSCVTWDEKTEIFEIVDPIGHQSDHDEITEMLTMNFDGNAQEKGAVDFRNADQMNFLFDKEDTPTSVSGQKHLDDVESEPDNYVDALNTIESESETDLDYQTKREVEQSSVFVNEETKDATDVIIAHHPDLQPVNQESCTTAYSSSTIVTVNDKPDCISSQCYAKEESHQMAEKSSDMCSSPGMDFSGNDGILDGSDVEFVVSSLPYSGFTELNPTVPVVEQITSAPCDSQKSPTEPSGVQSVMIWTNGSLLGLEPSKPPDFSIMNAAIQDSATRSADSMDGLRQSNLCNGEGDAKPDMLVQSSKILEQISSRSSTSRRNDQNDISDQQSGRFLPTNVDTKHEKYGDSHSINRLNNDHRRYSSETNAVVPETEQAVRPDVNAISTEAIQRDGENESQIFGLSSRFLVNGFQRKVSLVHGEKSEPPSSKKSGVFEQKSRNQSVSYQTFSDKTYKAHFGSGSPINSPSSSPPLQHMKISFQPINGFETSKLKLKFPDGGNPSGSSRDMLPAFQLVPEPATPQHDIGSESDDDTFCRSSPYMSDDCLSHHSDSNSEQWDSDDTPPSKNELYDALRRISSTGSVSSSVELDRTGHGSFHVDCGLHSPCVETCLEHRQSDHSLDLPSLSSLNPLFEKEMKIGSDAKDFPKSHPHEPSPLPPPLPPLQWRVMRSDSDVNIGKQDSVSETHSHAFEMKTFGSITSLQSKPSHDKQQQSSDQTISYTPNSKPEWQKVNGLKEVNQATNGRGIDEKEDFLHQIRSKSFNLRRTVTEKPNATTGPAANVKVTAILEKANAIRQAVGSDYGDDDDNWSDT